jgi:hypothetical protein
MSKPEESTPAKTPPPEKPEVPKEVKPAEIIEKALESAPPGIKEQIMTIFAAERWGPFPNPLIAKLTPEHITKLIDCAEEESKRSHSRHRIGRWQALIYFGLCLGFIVFLIVFLQNKEALLKDILIAILAFLGGGGVALGLMSFKTK